ncbi:MAG: aminodeoxychorismate/anthranilate synthase component II [Chitinophagales bacterium]|nr:aminodeoxychorismate/anthranilate synthase component II [Chitinophagales bacterium]MDW8428728.1 aminodeoxychorismate/anthranilate synthase component II [Chitinophagales bacterium]
MILLIDNYDSFTYILQDYFIQLGQQVVVYRNDMLTVGEAEALHADAIVFSPGPERPERAGNLMPLVAHFYNRKPMLGVCLGHQAIGLFFGARLEAAPNVMHGRTSQVFHNSHPLFESITSPFAAMRYHSLLLYDVPNTPLQPIAWTSQNELMALAHPHLPIAGVQFHPESILTPCGLVLLRNWLKWCGLSC